MPEDQPPPAPAPEAPEPDPAAVEYAAVWGAHARAAKWNRRIAVALAAALLACIVGWASTVRHVPEPIFVRVDAVGRAEVVAPTELYWDDDPADPVTRWFLEKFIRDHVRRSRHTAKEDWSRSLYFLSPEEASKAIDRDADGVAAVEAGRAPELAVEQVLLRIHPRPQPPHAAEITYVTAGPDGQGGYRRDSWTATLEFQFVTVNNPAFARVNPIGLVIPYLRLERATGG
ncbi:MAG: VirB8/TrbF family protein [bacterium]|nr:VirB8/TrbF family protein [bacterium]